MTWYDINIKKSTAIDEIRRYPALSLKVSPTNGLSQSSNASVSITVGIEKGCESYIGPEHVCNGPLQANKEYRYNFGITLKKICITD